MHNSTTLDLVIMIMTLLFCASIVGIISKKIKFPFTIFLVIIGLLLGLASHKVSFFHAVTLFRLTPDVVLFVFLPVLIFESAFNLDAKKLLKNIIPIMTLAVPALLISTFTVGFILHYSLELDLGITLLFGALISATDPVAVIALFKEIGAPKRLNLLVEGESLFNDGTALVLFKIILGVVMLGTFGPGTIAEGVLDFVVVFSGGVAVGIIFGVVFAKTIEIIRDDPLVEITLTTILAHSTFITAEHLLHVSGVMATVAAGLTMGSYGRNKISPSVQEHMASFWEYFAFVCNSLIFLLVGLSIDIHLFVENYRAILLAVLAVLSGRAIAVYTLFPLIERFKMVEPVGKSFQTVIFWGGLRGALAIAIALSIPIELAERSFILVLTLGVVLFTLLVNGLSVKPLMGRLGLNRFSVSENLERLQAIIHAKQKGWNDMLVFAETGAVDRKSVDAAKKGFRESLNGTLSELEKFRKSATGLGPRGESDIVLRHALKLERIEYHKLFEKGLIDENNLKEMTHIIDNELDRIKEGREAMGKGEAPPLFNRFMDIFFRTIGLVPVFKPLLMKYKTRKIAASYERKRARILAIPVVIDELEKMGKEETYPEEAIEESKRFYRKIFSIASERLEVLKSEYPEYVEKSESGILKRCRINSELETFRELYRNGAITEKVLRVNEEELERSLRKMKMRPVEEFLLSPRELISKVPCFSALAEENLVSLGAKLSAVSYLPNEVIVKEGEEGDSLFLVGRGQLEVVTKDREDREIPLATLKAGDFFGEIALLHPQPRTATVRALTPTTLLELKRDDLMPYLKTEPHLKEALEEAYRKRILHALIPLVPVFRELNAEDREAVASIMEYAKCNKGETVIREGEKGKKFYIIQDGEAGLSRGGEVISALRHGDFFGEEVLLKEGPYLSTVRAVTDLELYCLDIDKFRELAKKRPEIIRKEK